MGLAPWMFKESIPSTVALLGAQPVLIAFNIVLFGLDKVIATTRGLERTVRSLAEFVKKQSRCYFFRKFH